MKTLAHLVCLLIFGVGCAALNIQKPTGAVTGMAVQGVDAKGFTMNFNVDVTNPNTVALPLTAADYKVGFSGVNVADGNVKPEGSIPAGGTKTIVLPVTLTYDNLMSAEQSIVQSGGNIPYNLDAGLVLNSGLPVLGDVHVPLQYKGMLALKDILANPQAIMSSPAAQKLAKELALSFFGH